MLGEVLADDLEDLGLAGSERRFHGEGREKRMVTILSPAFPAMQCADARARLIELDYPPPPSWKRVT
jgi:hypothetical protein